jgi:hypothetical protein
MGFRGRDVEVVQIDEKQSLVMACDSAGAIGKKEYDIVQVEPYVVGRLTARVALLEILSVGAVPQMISATISNEPYPTGDGILEGVNKELISLNLSSLPIGISTEKNFKTSQTGLGVTVVGICKTSNLRVGSSKVNDLVYCLGRPKVGIEIRGAEDEDIIQGADILRLLSMEKVHDIIPVGSQGILGEAENMAETLGRKFICEKEINLDIIKSAGPSTCLIFTCAEDFKPQEFDKLPNILIGSLI